MAINEATTAQRRFGYGAVPGLQATVASDPRGYVRRQMDDYHYDDKSGLASSDALLRQLSGQEAAVRQAQLNGGDASVFDTKRKFLQDLLQAELAYRQDRAVASNGPLAERLVDFWSGHFCVSCSKGDAVRAVAGAYEREAIRPYVFGRFRDMLGAVMHHPAMLVYLDNTQSVGPDSPAGKRHDQGLNENLGRELMELHTIGVRAGYTQADVTEAARILTGWSIADPHKDGGGRFQFQKGRHQPGVFTVMGKTYAQQGEAQGEALLDDLARHPATAQHIAGKLVGHFVGTSAPAALTERVATAFRHSDGDLKATVAALVGDDAAWTAPADRVVPPYAMAISVQRLFGRNMNVGRLTWFTRSLGEPLWDPPSPNGFPDNADAWAAPNALVKRFDWAMAMAHQMGQGLRAADLAEAAFGPALDPDLKIAIHRAATPPEALAMLIMSPQVQMR